MIGHHRRWAMWVWMEAVQRAQPAQGRHIVAAMVEGRGNQTLKHFHRQGRWWRLEAATPPSAARC